jgi:Domain of unknown function (DUF4936)
VSDPRRELFVYYRVACAHWRDAANAVEQWQQQLRRSHPELLARVLRRPEAIGDMVTLMEVYAVKGGSVGSPLEVEIARGASALQPWLIGERRSERFDTLD